MFMGPLDAAIAWSETGLDGSRRFLDRVWRLFVNEDGSLSEKVTDDETPELEKVYHETVKKVTVDYENLHFNTAISQLMVFINDGYKQDKINRDYIKGFVKMLSPIAPHIAEELWEKLGGETTITYEDWPTYDESKLVAETVEIVAQVNGKVKDKIDVSPDATKDELVQIAMDNEKIQAAIEGKTVNRTIVVPGKLVNIVAK